MTRIRTETQGWLHNLQVVSAACWDVKAAQASQVKQDQDSRSQLWGEGGESNQALFLSLVSSTAIWGKCQLLRVVLRPE